MMGYVVGEAAKVGREALRDGTVTLGEAIVVGTQLVLSLLVVSFLGAFTFLLGYVAYDGLMSLTT